MDAGICNIGRHQHHAVTGSKNPAFEVPDRFVEIVFINELVHFRSVAKTALKGRIILTSSWFRFIENERNVFLRFSVCEVWHRFHVMHLAESEALPEVQMLCLSLLLLLNRHRYCIH